MKRKIRVLLIDDDEKVHDIVRETLTRDEFEFKAEQDTRTGLREVLRFKPDLLILDYILPEVSGMDALKELKSHQLTKEIPVLALSTADSPSVIESFYQLGAIDYITKPIVPRLLREKIRSLAGNLHLIERSNLPAAGHLVGFLGVKGGVGTSTVATSTALFLAQAVEDEGRKVLLLDTNGFSSSIRFFFDVKETASLYNLLREHPFDLDEDYLLGVLTQVADNLYLLPSSERMGQFEMVRDDDFSVVMYILLNYFDYVLVDMDRSFSDANLFILENAETLMLITNTTRPSLQNLHETVETLRRIGIDRNKLALALNGFERGDKITGDELLKFVGVPCLATFRNYPDKYMAAEESRIPAAAMPRSPVTGEYRDFVETIIELTGSEVPELARV
jgi:pilus assembly protein CpaE